MTKRTVNSLRELQSLTELRRVMVYELSGKRKDGFGLESSTEEPRSSDIQVSINLDDKFLSYRCRLETSSKVAIFDLDIAVMFALGEPVEGPSDELMAQFSEHALPLAVSYLRVYLQQVARQLNVPTPMLKHRWPHEIEGFRLKADGDPGQMPPRRSPAPQSSPTPEEQ